MANFSFRVVQVPGSGPAVAEVTGEIPAGVYQVSGHDNRDGDNPDAQVTISIVQHDGQGAVVVGASGYAGA